VVKCSKCGAFSYPELTQCNMCGASLLPAAPAKIPPAPASPETEGAEQSLGPSPPAGKADAEIPDEIDVTDPASISLDAAPSPAESAPGKTPEARTVAVNLDLGFEPERREGAAAASSARSPQRTPWRQEVSERVLSFRERRAKLRNEPPEEQNLDFEFERSETKSANEPDMERFIEFPQDSRRIDADIGPPAALDHDAIYSDEETREPGEEVFEIPDSPRPRAQDFELEPDSGGRLEIVVESAESGAPSAASQLEEEAFQVAALGPRFLAGLIDGLLLLLSAGLFAFIFRFAGGHLRLVPLNLAVLGVIATIFIWSYFGMFTALTATTPGQSWMGIEARNMEGWPPDRRESLLRAFGYLVSLSAFLLGFFWALVDGESLTWHDRISGTFLTPARQGVPAKGFESKP
jgi:uncharacterized RDD family membrane protein YckC